MGSVWYLLSTAPCFWRFVVALLAPLPTERRALQPGDVR
jgi:hypothetical protein